MKNYALKKLIDLIGLAITTVIFCYLLFFVWRYFQNVNTYVIVISFFVISVIPGVSFMFLMEKILKIEDKKK
jgi:hypothetical protein